MGKRELARYLSEQLNFFFPDGDPMSKCRLLDAVERADNRVFHCFANIQKKYFTENGVTYFNHLVSDQYCMFLYMLANHVFEDSGDEVLATKIYYLNKALHGVDIFYTTRLPDVFLLVHPLGSVIGRAEFSGFFVAYQGVTIGCLNEGVFPKFQGRAVMYANSRVLGDCKIGDNVCFAADAVVFNENIPPNQTVIGKSPALKLKPNGKEPGQRPPFVYG